MVQVPASEKTWKGQEENGKDAPLIVLRSIPPGSPSALRPSFSDQYNMEKVASEYEGTKGRMLDDEAKWWEDFIKSETEKRALWDTLEERNLMTIGGDHHPLQFLKEHKQQPKNGEQLTQNELTRRLEIDKLIEKENSFKPVITQFLFY